MGERIFIITGVNKGFGNALMRAALRRNLKVEGISRSKKSKNVPDSCKFTQLDCSNSCIVADFWKKIVNYYGKKAEISLINNAGYYFKKNFMATEPEDYKRTIESNLYCALSMIRGFVQYYQSGRIINIVSTSALLWDVPRTSLSLKSAYSAAKAAEQAMLKSIEIELEAKNWTITNYFPRNINTWSIIKEPDSFDSDEFAEWVIDKDLFKSSLKTVSCIVLPH